jgi:hypothetical protein
METASTHNLATPTAAQHMSPATADTHHRTSPYPLPPVAACGARLQVNGRFGIQASVRMTPSQATSRAVQDNCCYVTRSMPTRG